MTTTDWQSTAAQKRASVAALIPHEWQIPADQLPGPEVLNVVDVPTSCGVLSAKEVEITESTSAEDLVGKLAKGVYTAVEVTTAFCKRAVIAHQLVNCLTEIFFDKALAKARELDEYYAKTGKTVGPLHGLPISLKDQIEVEGTEATMCYVGWVGRPPSTYSAVLAELLLQQGAVLYVRTNMSQGLWFGEGYNNLFGRTLNPYNRNLTCGGSSGGEGALVGLRGSICGIGSDIGGSVRIPAAYQGLYGLRGSSSRIPYSKASNSSEGQEVVKSILGPICTSLDGVKLFYKAVLAAKPWDHDPWTPRMPWSEDLYHLAEHGGEGGKLTFGIMWDDGVVLPTPGYTRAMEEVKASLLAAGHEVVDWEPYKAEEAISLLAGVFNADGGKDLAHQLSLSGEPVLGAVLDHNAKEMGTYAFFQHCHRRTQLIKEALDQWTATASRTKSGRPVDAIIAPASACPPGKHDDVMYIGYTGYCNLTDWSASVFPVTAVDPALDVKPQRSEGDFKSAADKMTYEQYDPAYQAGAPLSLQLIGKKYEEEAVIRMTEIVVDALKASRG